MIWNRIYGVQDTRSVFTKHRDPSTALTEPIRRHPDCQSLVPRYCTHRFQPRIKQISCQRKELIFLEEELGKPEHDLIAQTTAHSTNDLTSAETSDVNQQVDSRHAQYKKMEMQSCKKVPCPVSLHGSLMNLQLVLQDNGLSTN